VDLQELIEAIDAAIGTDKMTADEAVEFLNALMEAIEVRLEAMDATE